MAIRRFEESVLYDNIRGFYYHIVFPLDIFLFIVAWPLMVIFVCTVILSLRCRKRNRSAIFAGIELVIDKTIARGDALEKHGITSYYYTKNVKGSVKRKGLRLIKSPVSFFFDIIKFLLLLVKVNPAYIEIYYRGHVGKGIDPGIYQMIFIKIMQKARILNAVVLRGELYAYNEFSAIHKYFYKRALKTCSMILYRELYMKEILAEMGIDEGKIHFDPNKVKVDPLSDYTRCDNNVLYLNRFKRWRRIELVVRSAKIVKEKIKEVKFFIVGSRTQEEHDLVMALINDLGLSDTVSVLPWTDTPRDYYDKAKVFILPANLVYLNYSLLEAMERGVVPIIADVDDADKIVQHGVDGFICAQDERIMAEKTTELLQDEKLRIKMAKAARHKVQTEFNDISRMDIIVDEINKQTLSGY